VELEGISIEALADPSRYRRPVEEEVAEETAKSFLESKQNRTSILRDLNIKSKPKRSKTNKTNLCIKENLFQ
jgi:hypothetical protein